MQQMQTINMDSKKIIYHEEINTSYKHIWTNMWPKNHYTDEYRGLFSIAIGKPITLLIMNICNELGLSSQIMFTSLENYDLFFIKQYMMLSEKFRRVQSISTERKWLAIYEMIKKNFILRIISVIQIVTKQIDKNSIFTIEMIEDILVDMNFCDFNKSDIIKSEFYVFQVMGFQVSSSISCETIEILIKTCLTMFTECTRHFHKTCMLVLQHACLNRDQIYNDLASLLKDKSAMSELMADKVLFGAAVVVATATKFKFPVNQLKYLVKQICTYNIPNTEHDLECLAASILESGLV